MPRFDHFDILAPIYERVFHTSGSQKLNTLLEIPADGLLLDVGGGTGRVAYYLSFSGCRIIIADPSLGMLQQARTRTALKRLCCNAEHLPFDKDTFDRIILIDSFHHVLDQTHTADELWRILKPCGRLVIEEPDIRHWAIRVLALLEKMIFMRSHFFTSEEIVGLFPSFLSSCRIEVEGHNAWIVINKNG